MASKKRSNSTKTKVEVMNIAGAPFIKALPMVSLGELSTVAACLRLLKRTGVLKDYFEEALELIKEADEFLRASQPAPLAEEDLIITKRIPEGRIHWVQGAKELTASISATALTLNTLLKQVVEREGKEKKGKTWFGAITKKRPLQDLIRKAGRAKVLTDSEVSEILDTERMGFDHYFRLIDFQKKSNKLKGRRPRSKTNPPGN
jgi:hypothetical protein